MRSEWQTHKGQQFFFCNYASLEVDALETEMDFVRSVITQHPAGSLRILTDVRGIIPTRQIISAFIKIMPQTKKHLYKSAVIGIGFSGQKKYCSTLFYASPGEVPKYLTILSKPKTGWRSHNMLLSLARFLTYLTALLYAILGAILFLLPEQISPVFAWKVSPFVTMTIGGWCLGNAWLAFLVARRWRWDLIYSTLFYLSLFGALETGVAFVFREKLQLGHPIAWLYLMTLAVNLLMTLLGILAYLRLRPTLSPDVLPVSGFLRGLTVVFIAFVGFLGYYGLTANIGDFGTNGGIFPEVISLFTLRSFGAFYFSLALGVIPLLWAKSAHSYLSHGFISSGLLIFITLAAFACLRVFDFRAHPSQMIYIGTYLVVGGVVGFLLWKFGTGMGRN